MSYALWDILELIGIPEEKDFDFSVYKKPWFDLLKKYKSSLRYNGWLFRERGAFEKRLGMYGYELLLSLLNWKPILRPTPLEAILHAGQKYFEALQFAAEKAIGSNDVIVYGIDPGMDPMQVEGMIGAGCYLVKKDLLNAMK